MSIFKKSSKELRKFGMVMAVGFGIIGSIFLWKDHQAWRYLYGIGGFFLLFGLVLPKVLEPIEWAWMKFAHALGIVMTFILLTVTYLVVITPIGLAMRAFGKDPLNRKFDKTLNSYWVAVDPLGPTSRVDKPY